MPYIEDREIMAINNMFAAEMFNKLDIPPLYEFKTKKIEEACFYNISEDGRILSLKGNAKVMHQVKDGKH